MDLPANEAWAGLPPELAREGRKGLLRFLTCGSVDDGKSTLIGRLLYDSRLIFEDQLAALARDSRKHGTTGEDLDFALLVDGLEAEREQGITIDVAYRFFTTPARKFIVADCPGHEQYTRNMVTGASTASLAIVLVDARNGVMTQTCRHSYIAALLGIRHIVLAVNKIDLVDFDETRFDEIRTAYLAFAGRFEFACTAIPISARFGDNVIRPSPRTPWYRGPCLLEHLETVEVDESAAARPFRMQVQWVNRPNLDFRGYAGTVAAGAVRPGEAVVNAASGQASTVRRLVSMDGDLDEARQGEAVTLVLEDEIDVSRGDVLAARAAPPEVADQFAAHLVWMAEVPLFAGRSYLVKVGTATVVATITEIKHRVDINSFEKVAARQLRMNEVAVVNLALARPIAFAPYAEDRRLGGFIVIDRLSNATVGAGMIDFALWRGTNIKWQALTVDKTARAHLKHQRPVMVWFTGLSGAGKSTIANLVEQKLFAAGCHTYMLDGDNIRHGLNRDLGFTEADRIENIRRAAETAKLFVDAGLIVLVSFISPYRGDRDSARALVSHGEFVEVFVDTPIAECELRDPKGLYRKARQGQIRHFTGIDAPYERPESPEIHLDTTQASADAAAEQVVVYLRGHGIIG
ncbi:MAG: sulfate adenylyltransferase subunit CysN [Acidisphaera sp.]|nr:sulfate adenylyltransferase subunit CysN [Acidisphaera sp.]